MKHGIFQSGIEKIFDMFIGSRSKRPSPEALNAWYGCLQHIPDEAVDFIVERICDMERLPSNMPLAWKILWSEWKAMNPTRIVRPYCRACDNHGARFVWAPVGNGRWHHFAVPCPACQTNSSRPPVSLQDLECSGCVVMPTGYEGGVVAFDRDRGFGCFWLDEMRTGSSQPEKSAHENKKQAFSSDEVYF